MSLPRSTRKLIEAQNFDAVEDEWLTQLESGLEDLTYFSATARALAATDGTDRARQLLELLHDQLIAEELLEDRLSLLEATGEISFAPEKLHSEILAAVKKLYGESEVFDALADKLGLHRAIEDIPKTWRKVARLRGLLGFDVGSIVSMEGKGVGRVVDVNVQLEKLKVDFESHPGLTVGFGAATKVLVALPPEHFLRRKLEDSDSLEKLAAEDPQELLRLILTDLPNQTATQLKASMQGLIAAKSWASWWARARSHPQVVGSGKGARQSYSWAESAAAAGEEVLSQFGRADLGQQIEIFLREVKRNPESAAELATQLTESAVAARDKQPSVAIEILAAFDRSSLGAIGPNWTAEDLLTESRDPASLVRGLGDRSLRLACLERLQELREDWPRIFSNVIGRETDSSILTFLFEKLWDSEREAADALVDRALSRPAKQPAAFLWLLANIDSLPYFGKRNPARALNQFFRAPELPEFAPHRTAIKRMLADGEVTAALIQRLTTEQVEAVQELFERTPMEEYLRNRLLTALHMKFPDFRSKASDTLYATRAVIEEKRTELKTLLDVEIPANRKAIEEARALGDLRENFEYKSARQRHEYLSARVSGLEADLERAQPIAFDQLDSSEARIGVTVELKAKDDSTRTLSILGPWESNPDLGILSYESEAGARLLGKRAGEEVEIGQEVWRIASIRPYQAASE